MDPSRTSSSQGESQDSRIPISFACVQCDLPASPRSETAIGVWDAEGGAAGPVRASSSPFEQAEWMVTGTVVMFVILATLVATLTWAS